MSYDATTYPFETVVYITDTIGNNTFQGSGVLIAPDEVLTAAHMVYDSGVGTATNIVVHPGYSGGDSQYGSDTGNYIHYELINNENDKISNQDSQFDFALIHLASPLPQVGYMGMLANYSGGQVNITGYPGTSNGLQVNSVQNVTLRSGLSLFDGRALGAGSSGGPLWIDKGQGQGPQVVGLVSASDAAGTGFFMQLTNADFDQIESWIQSDHQRFSTTGAMVSNDMIAPNAGTLEIASHLNFIPSTGEPTPVAADPSLPGLTALDNSGGISMNDFVDQTVRTAAYMPPEFGGHTMMITIGPGPDGGFLFHDI
jgi:V8-like Glu-specific endopeptidase